VRLKTTVADSTGRWRHASSGNNSSAAAPTAIRNSCCGAGNPACPSRLSGGLGGQTIAFCGLFEWAFGPRIPNEEPAEARGDFPIMAWSSTRHASRKTDDINRSSVPPLVHIRRPYSSRLMGARAAAWMRSARRPDRGCAGNGRPRRRRPRLRWSKQLDAADSSRNSRSAPAHSSVITPRSRGGAASPRK